ncbi:MAG TPA: DUF4388 domain-containing protein, partial [Longimicrobium sp.]|nr:DUF4388 domain-containing protein [Longimicrobium sp.]
MDAPLQVFIRNDKGRIWGPLSLATVSLLLDNGMVEGKVQVSKDGLNFAFPGRFPDLRDAFPRDLWGDVVVPGPEPTRGAAQPAVVAQTMVLGMDDDVPMAPVAPPAGPPPGGPMAGPGATGPRPGPGVPMAGPGVPMAGPGAAPRAGPGVMAGPGATAHRPTAGATGPRPAAGPVAGPGTTGPRPAAGVPTAGPGINQPRPAAGVPMAGPGAPRPLTGAAVVAPSGPQVPPVAAPTPPPAAATPPAPRPAPKPAAPVPDSAFLPPSGSLSEHSPIHLYYLAASQDVTGLLTLQLPDRSIEVHFRKGNPEYVASSHADDSLAGFLLKNGLATADQLKQAEAGLDRFGGELVGALFGLGILNPGTAFAQLAQRASALLLKAILSESGSFTFEGKDLAAHRAMPLGNKWAVLSDLVRRVPIPELKRRLTAAVDLPIMKSGGRVATTDLKLTPQETRALTYIDGVRSLSQLWSDLPQEADALARLAFMLRDMELVSFASTPVAPRAA